MMSSDKYILIDIATHSKRYFCPVPGCGKTRSDWWTFVHQHLVRHSPEELERTFKTGDPLHVEQDHCLNQRRPRVNPDGSLDWTVPPPTPAPVAPPAVLVANASPALPTVLAPPPAILNGPGGFLGAGRVNILN